MVYRYVYFTRVFPSTLRLVVHKYVPDPMSMYYYCVQVWNPFISHITFWLRRSNYVRLRLKTSTIIIRLPLLYNHTHSHNIPLFISFVYIINGAFRGYVSCGYCFFIRTVFSESVTLSNIGKKRKSRKAASTLQTESRLLERVSWSYSSLEKGFLYSLQDVILCHTPQWALQEAINWGHFSSRTEQSSRACPSQTTFHSQTDIAFSPSHSLLLFCTTNWMAHNFITAYLQKERKITLYSVWYPL